LLKEYQEDHPDLFIGIFAPSLYQVIFDEQIDEDLLWSVASVMFVLFYLWVHIGSLFLAICSIIMILLSFPMTQMIYTYGTQITYNASLNQLTIFIIMGIAADDIFVFIDAWKQSGAYNLISFSNERRMAYAFRRAQKSIFVTSTTTCVAFLANGLSDQVPIRGFGIFAAIIVPVNYLMVIFIMPSAVMIYERDVKNCLMDTIDRCLGKDKKKLEKKLSSQNMSE